YVDGTAGSGGHTLALLQASAPDGVVIAIDRDADALVRVRERVGDAMGRCRLVRGNFADIQQLVDAQQVGRVDGIMMDLGVSSEQLNQGPRGFSFNHDGPLDMRMNQDDPLTAETVVNTWPEAELTRIFRHYGEEQQGRRIARAIVAARDVKPLRSTLELAEVISAALGGRRGRLHPATRAFQGLRIAVNDELAAIERGLDGALNSLRVGGRLAVISFHSLEDRPVKQFMARHAGRWESLAAGGREWRGELPAVERITRKPVYPTDHEMEMNPRSRSAKLRVAQRVDRNQEAA
ncbi:MAG: 16S rRNA (cytosine(1402)-N(4))-methyltransferase RsmH, partial [Verrucomicrobia bacterium]|nr:16S rRNA (cytosine(1402)-N(4))-methyltransferase RsmH [Verrucomicrobiota bacterium]